MVSQAELILRVITLWFLVLYQFFFRDGMGPFKLLVFEYCLPEFPQVDLDGAVYLIPVVLTVNVLGSATSNILCLMLLRAPAVFVVPWV